MVSPGLSADLHAQCVVNFSGKPHVSLNAAYEFARTAEQRWQATKSSNGKRPSITPVDALHAQPSHHHKRTRGTHEGNNKKGRGYDARSVASCSELKAPLSSLGGSGNAGGGYSQGCSGA
jgi:hypothetical protein